MMRERNEIVCPNCERHCPIDEVCCPRGEMFAAELRDKEGADGRFPPFERGDMPRRGGCPRGRGPEGGPRRRFPEGGPREFGPRGRFPEGGPREFGPRGRFPEGGPREFGPRGRFPEGSLREFGLRGFPGLSPMPLEDDGSLSTLLFRCAHEMHRPDGRGGSQGRVLRMLAKWDGLSQRALQAEMGVQPGSLSELISKLEAKGLLVREQDGEDKRRVVLHLTEAGRTAAAELPDPGSRDSRFAALTQEEQETLRALLRKLLGVAENEEEKE